MSVALNEEPKAEAGALIKLAIMALGGQGGGVLANWVLDLAESNGYVAQATSVAGVAQRTGATIYYVEMAPAGGAEPVFSLSPAEGDVDILLAAELMEAGRAILRGFVTPDQTVLIASSHRAFATSEKTAPGLGLASAEDVVEAAEANAKRFVAFDMEQVASEAGSVISASLFGALSGAGALPFPRAAFEATIAKGGRGVEASLRAFAEAHERAVAGGPVLPTRVSSPDLAEPLGPARQLEQWRALAGRVDGLPGPVQAMARPGLRKVVDFQDTGYGAEYLDRVEGFLGLDGADREFALSVAAAKHIANAMAYDDVIRVADLKTRASRWARVSGEVGVAPGQVLQVTEYMHPRMEEVCGLLPAGLGRWIEARPRLFNWLDRRVAKGRRVRTDGLFWFMALTLVSGLKRWRRGSHRHEVETGHFERWLELAHRTAEGDYDLGVEILNTRRLVKGYSDTHARGLSKFDRVLSALPMLAGREDAADWMRRLREAALAEEGIEKLEGALKTIESFAKTPN